MSSRSALRALLEKHEPSLVAIIDGRRLIRRGAGEG